MTSFGSLARIIHTGTEPEGVAQIFNLSVSVETYSYEARGRAEKHELSVQTIKRVKCPR